ncbi:MAG: hypothetical protein ABH883_05305 [Candidatus Omnitrophota bacterium]
MVYFYTYILSALDELSKEKDFDYEYVKSRIIQEFVHEQPTPTEMKAVPIPDTAEEYSTDLQEKSYTQPELIALPSAERLEINILGFETLKGLKKLDQDTSYVIVDDSPLQGTDKGMLRIHNFTDAALFGILQAACMYAKIQDDADPESEPVLPNTVNDVFPIVKRMFERVQPGEIIDKDVFENMLFNRKNEVRMELYKTFSFPDLIRDVWHSLIHYYDNVYKLWRDA